MTSEHGFAATPSRSVAFIGAGPTAASLLERLSASYRELLGGVELHVHLVDPFPAGRGRVWRPDQSPLVWMNSMAEDVTIFTDGSVRCDGPIVPGPTLLEWSQAVLEDPRELARLSPEIVGELTSMTGMTFPTRRVQTGYLDWVHRRVRAALPAGIVVHDHAARAVALDNGIDGADGSQIVTTSTGERITADVVVLSLGHLDAHLSRDDDAIAEFARRHGLVFHAAGHTAEFDLSDIDAGADVIARGFGQAFTDLVAMLTEGRGGRFVTETNGPAGATGATGATDTPSPLRYEASGREPLIHVGSRRGVPYRSKLDYRLQAPMVALPKFLDEATIAALVSRETLLEFRPDILPLLLKDIGWAYYHELFTAHPDRVAMTWDEFADRYSAAVDEAEIAVVVRSAVREAEDRFDLLALDRPLAGLRFDSIAAFGEHLRAHIDKDVRRRTDAAYSADLAAFTAMLQMFGVLGRINGSGRMTNRSRVEDVSGWWFDFFMYYASGPPPGRLRQLLALADAGIVRFIGAGMEVHCDEARGRFAATSTSHGDEVVASVLVDARVAKPTVSRTADGLLAALFLRGDVAEESVTDRSSGWTRNTGKVVVGGHSMRLVGADGAPHPRRHALGVFTSRPAAGAFARPNTNAPIFRQNDAVARSILSTLADLAARDGQQPDTPLEQQGALR